MIQIKKGHFWLAILVFAILVFSLLALLSTLGDQQAATISINLPSETVQARVVEIVESGEITLGDTTQNYQIIHIEVLEGEAEGQILEIDFGLRQVRPPGPLPQVDDVILVSVGRNANQGITAFFVDFVRSEALIISFLVFAMMSILISGWKGVRGLLGMAISLGVIILYILPNILAGKNPVMVSITGAFALLSVTLYLVYGWNLKTHAAVLGTLISLTITGLLAAFFTQYTRLTGFSNEEALFLIQQSAVTIDLRGIVLGGMLIGALGVLDDLVITQSSVTFTLHHTDPSLPFRELYRRAMRVGQDHVAATVNTLVLAYAGAALPTMLLFSLSSANFSQLVNYEFVAEEIVRTLVGSMGLMAAVPITTSLACLVAIYHERLGVWAERLGGTDGEAGHAH